MVRQGRRQAAFTLVEMLTTVALLVIVLGLMVSLARYVRRRSAEDLTRRVLLDLDESLRRYLRSYDRPTQGRIVESLGLALDEGPVDERALELLTLENNRRFVRALEEGGYMAQRAFRDLPLSIYGESMLRDAWGMPIVLMPRMHRSIGMAPNDAWFFFSAGPDRLYLTRGDNQYSYEALGLGAGTTGSGP